MDDVVRFEARLSLIHLDRFNHQGSHAVDPNLTVEDIASLCFPMVILFYNAYNIQRRMEAEFQPTIY